MLRHDRFDNPRAAMARAGLAFLLLSASCAAAARAAEPDTNPLGGGGVTVVEPVPERPAARSQRIVFTCVTPDLTTFSDRPCGPLPERRSIELQAATERGAGEAASVVPRRATASTRPAVRKGGRDAPAPDPNAGLAGCDKLRATVAAIDRQMRAGYSARQAPRIWERWRDAKDRLHAAGCR
jgi:hypothetical protein